MPIASPGDASFSALPVIPALADKYQILGVSQQATAEELKVAYRRLALLYHPDRHGDANHQVAEEAFKRISAAYRTLSDDDERRRYDSTLNQGGVFHESVEDATAAILTEILAEIDTYEHIFTDDALGKIDRQLEKLVNDSLMAKLGEHIVGVWPMAAPPAGSSFQGNYVHGAVVLTNLRLLLPFTYSWEVRQGNTTYRYSRAGGSAFVLPHIARFTIISEGRLRKKVWVEINHAQGTTRFRPGKQNLGKLLLIARLWGIPVAAHQVDTPGADLRRALWSVWRPVLGLFVVGVAVEMVVHVTRGGTIEHPIQFVGLALKRGLWQWMTVTYGIMAGRRIWQWVMIYRRMEPAESLAGAAVGGDATTAASQAA